ncbi:hypothetical protein HK098_004843 [Nowakowskiella sp. JEL0407]|nr:hypothetical protein HK098_004843 [Nowakowskiella sp. JEL0407]
MDERKANMILTILHNAPQLANLKKLMLDSFLFVSETFLQENEIERKKAREKEENEEYWMEKYDASERSMSSYGKVESDDEDGNFRNSFLDSLHQSKYWKPVSWPH